MLCQFTTLFHFASSLHTFVTQVVPFWLPGMVESHMIRLLFGDMFAHFGDTKCTLNKSKVKDKHSNCSLTIIRSHTLIWFIYVTHNVQFKQRRMWPWLIICDSQLLDTICDIFMISVSSRVIHFLTYDLPCFDQISDNYRMWVAGNGVTLTMWIGWFSVLSNDITCESYRIGQIGSK